MSEKIHIEFDSELKNMRLDSVLASSKRLGKAMMNLNAIDTMTSPTPKPTLWMQGKCGKPAIEDMEE